MPKLIAIHQIHRTGKNGKPEVIEPKQSFDATKEEVALFVEHFGAAYLAAGEEASTQAPSGSEGGDTEPVDPATLNFKDLSALAKKLGITIPKGTKQPALLELVQAKLAAPAEGANPAPATGSGDSDEMI